MNQLNCREFVELATEFLEGALDEPARQRFLRHLPRCLGCERHLDQFRETISSLGRLPAEPLSDVAREQLLTAFRDWCRS